MNEESSAGKTSILKAVILAWLTTSLHFFVALIVCAYMMLVVPRYKRMADGFGTLLPPAAVNTILLSDSVVNYWYALLLAVIMIGGTIALMLQFLPEKLRWIRTCWLVSWPTAAVVFLFFESLVLAIVIERLANDLS